MPKLSIITVNLNNAKGLCKTVESVVNQTFTDYEYIIIDGGSADGSVEVIKEYANKITYWVSEPDKGIYSAMNKGILRSKGEYIQFLNSGDLLVNETILSKVFEVPRIGDIIYGHINIVTESESKVYRSPGENQFSLSFFFENTLSHPSTFIARKLFNSGLFDESFVISADKKFLLEKIIAQNCVLERLDEIIVNYNTEGLSNKPENQAKVKEENDRIFAQIVPSYIVNDFKIYRDNYSDFQALLTIKKNRISYFVFKIVKKTTLSFQKYFQSK